MQSSQDIIVKTHYTYCSHNSKIFHLPSTSSFKTSSCPPALSPSLKILCLYRGNFPGGSDCKQSAYNVGHPGSIPGLGSSPGEGNVNPLQYSCLENPMDGGAWRGRVHGVAKRQTRLKQISTQSPWELLWKSQAFLENMFIQTQKKRRHCGKQNQYQEADPIMVKLVSSLQNFSEPLTISMQRSLREGSVISKLFHAHLIVPCQE